MPASAQQSPPDYYALLGISCGASEAELRRAWRHLASQHHPDRAGIGATATFQQLSAAYTILSDPLARAAYDRRRRATQPAPATAPPSSRAARPSVPAIYISRLCGALDLLLNCGAAHLDEAGFITLVLRQTEATQGGMASISMYVELRCPKCASQSPRGSCAHCDSTGIVEELYSAWLAIPPGITDGHILTPTVGLAGMVQPVRFRVRIHAK